MADLGTINVLANLNTARWSASQAMAYEVAQEGVRQAIGYYAQLIATAEANADPDLAAIAGWRAEQEAWAQRGQKLTPLDTRLIERISSDADELLTDLDDEDEEDEESDDEPSDAVDADEEDGEA
ncbi:hypothetical protein ACIA49_10310 [Kribbella sp. NPDC051587]|uniref:hypothetical protein n=1 Tax=Kribbella sp. NPDC051587 TaxID=3364119 RepID=UPI0037AB4209